MKKEEKVVAPKNETESEGGILLTKEQTRILKEKGEVEIEIEDADVGLTEKHVEAIKKENKKKVVARHVLNPEQQKIYKKVLKAAEMPVKMNNTDFKLGKNELDIRYLNKENRDQMIFRSLVLNNIYLKEISTSLIDILRALFVVADAMGVTDIIEKTDEIIEKMNKRVRKTINETPEEEKKTDA